MQLFIKQKKPALKLPQGLTKAEQKQVREIIERAKRDSKTPKTAQDSIPFLRMYPDGICKVTENYYTKSIEFNDINYQLALSDDQKAIFDEWCSFLNFFDNSISFELSFMNLTADAEECEKQIVIAPQNDGFDEIREEYSGMIKNQFSRGNNGLVRKKYITFGIECKSLSEAKTKLSHRKVIRVCKTLVYRPEPGKGSVVRITTPKTEAGERMIPMLDEVYDAFLEEYQIQKILGFSTQEIDGYSGFVFSTNEGNAYVPECINRAIDRITKCYNKEEEALAQKEKRDPLLLPHFSAHHLRHTFCTRLCENESNIKVIQSIMGHSDYATTMDIYAECTMERQQEAFAELNGKVMIK